MSGGKVVGIIVLIVIVGIGLAYVGGFDEYFPDPPPKVKFYDDPRLSPTNVPENTSAILDVTARNLERNQTVSNVVARLSVIEGENFEKHLEFQEFTKLSDEITAGSISDKKSIPIKAIELSGKETKFTMQIEILVEGVQTDKRDFEITIIPN